MATNNKKRTRGKSSISTARPRSYSELYKNDNTVSAPPTTSVTRAAEPRYAPVKSAETVDLKGQYAYVMSDLRLLLIVSVALVAIIFVAKLFT